jgi:triosephosphate isomerase
MRKAIVAGNWKMNGSKTEASALIQSLKSGAAEMSAVEIAIFPPFVHIPLTQYLLKDSAIAWGGQNLYVGNDGAFTGEVAGFMLVDYGCRYVLVGHSERRQLFKENLELVAAKFQAAIAANLKPILCIGETQSEREQQATEAVLTQQLESVFAQVPAADFQQAVIAYEPVWAIGTGLTATPEQAQAAHAFIRQLVATAVV